MSSERDPHQRFSNTVENYRLYRPRYPKGVCDLLARRLDLAPGTRVADLGAGTGILSEDLLDFGANVVAVEPNEPMRTAAESELGDRAGFHTIAGSAEATQLPEASVEGVLAAQAFHWFDPERARAEVLRIGTENVWAAMIWNTRRLERTLFLRDYEAFCREWGSADYDKVSARYAGHDALSVFFGSTNWTREVLDNAQELDRAGLRGRLLSCSYFPGADDASYEDMLAAMESMFEAHQNEGLVVLEYDTEVFWGRMGEAG